MDMPKPRLPYVTLEIARGRRFWYFRRRPGLRIRLRGDYGSPDFIASYNAALVGIAAPQKQTAAPQGTLGWLVDVYQMSSDWDRLSKATKSQRGNIYKAMLKKANYDIPLTDIDQAAIERGKEDRAKTPFAANDWLKAMHALFKWGKSARHVTADPTLGVKGFPHKTEGFHLWSEDEIARFEGYWPIGTRERLAFSIFLWTGLRRGDAVMLGRQHIREGLITIRTGKTGQQIEIPVLQELQRIMDATPQKGLTFIAKDDGSPMTKEGFGNWFRKACIAAGVSKGRAHGLRKASATNAAECGYTESELNAWYGWAEGSRQSATYTRKANRRKLTQAAARKLSKP